MTAQRAIKILDYMAGENVLYKCSEEEIKAIEMAEEALEKQIPKKPLKAYDEQVEQHWLSCPMCYKGLCWEHSLKPKHCSECGQKLDWRNTK